MNNLQRYVNYAQPVVKVIREQHNEFFRLEYFSVSAEDLTAEDGLIEFMTPPDYSTGKGVGGKGCPEDFNGEIPLVYAQWGEESGASIVLAIAPEQRKLLSPEVLDVIKTEHLEYHEKWRKTADQTVYLRMDHEYYQTCAGFAPSDEFEDTVGVGFALDFISHRLGLNYLVIHDGWHDLEYILDSEE